MISLVNRIIKQMINDKRSLALMMLAPLLIMALVNALLSVADVELKILAVDLPATYNEKLASSSWVERAEAPSLDRLERGEFDAIIQRTAGGLLVTLYQPDASIQGKVMLSIQQLSPDQRQAEINYMRGNPDWGFFDTYIGNFLSILSFFFIFLIAGITFVRERTSGTLERMLQTPISRSAVIGGYTLGFGLFATLQSQLILLFVKYGLKATFEGTYITVGIIMTLIAITAVSTGALVSIFATNEFQIVQFIPIVIIPQVFLSGLIPIQQLPAAFAKLPFLTPIYYGSVALEKSMLYGESITGISSEIIALSVILIVLFTLNTLALRAVKGI